MGNRIDIINLGCSKNLVDSEKLSRQLELCGYTVRHDPERIQCDIAIVNTCGFIGEAKEESINVILELASMKQSKQIKRLFVMGCLSGRYIDDLPSEIPEVDKFYGKFSWNEIVSDLGKSYHQESALQRTITTPSHFAYLKISEGCNRHCAYCAIPIITGRHQSRPMEEIVSEVEWLVQQGVKEFQVIAQDLSYYGKDLYGEFRLAKLIEKISDVPGVQWIRLHYAYPAKFPYDILRVIRERDNVCNYLDIALQHVSDPVLQRMRRNVSSKETIELIRRIRDEVPGIHLRTTLLTGFPGESEADFEALMNFVKTMRFERMGAFPYSEEEGTYSALHYDDDIPFEVKQARVDQLMEIQQQISEELNRAKIGSVLRVIIDREEGDCYVGRTEFDSPEVDPEVLIPKNKILNIGEFYEVKIVDAEAFELMGEVL
ncbi:MAG: 30S ribosomal protein S12 methylthiotransferase RimO [Paludibacteraceae bacterium]|nr:30S ribosomal protein S12 methylthiotransferase RimO [Paludibacteraceae bacterium]